MIRAAPLPRSAGVRARSRRSATAGTVLFLLMTAAIVPRAIADSGAAIVSAALAPRSVATGPTLFTELTPAETGIHAANPYDDPRMWTDSFERFAYGSMGTGVTIGDYDGDGRPDIFVTCKTAPNHLFRNLGNWRFADVTEAAGVAGPSGAWKSGATFVDVNNDGRLDLYVCRIGAPNLLYLNQGDGTFAERGHEFGLDISDASVMGAFCDYDRDGWLDLYLVTNLLDYEKHPDGQRDQLWRNRGDGTFVNVTDSAGLFGEGQKHAAVWWDYDNDGWPDVYVTHDYGWPDQLFHNNGDGTFTNTLGAVVPHIPRFSMGADLGDVNNDGRIDLFVPDMLPTTRERDQRAMIDARAHIADLPDPAMTPQYMRNAIFLNTGTGRCLEVGCLAGVAATDWTWSPRLEDLDNDGRLDLFITNGSIREFFDGDLRKRLDELPPVERRRLFKNSPVLRERNLAFCNRGDLDFENVSATWGLNQLGVSFGTAFGDLDGDGDLDVIFTNFDSDVTVCRNDSPGGHRLLVALRGLSTSLKAPSLSRGSVSNRFGVGATVRIETAAGLQVRPLVLARGYMSSSDPVLHFGLGDHENVTRLTVTWPSGRQQSFEHLAADHRYTITEPADPVAPPPRPKSAGEPEPSGQFVEVAHAIGLDLRQEEKPFDELAAQPLLPLRQNFQGPGVAVGDVDGDRIDDVVFGGSSGAPARVLLAQSDGTFAAGATLPSSGDASGVADAAPLLFDFDGDGANDLLLAKSGVSAPAGSAAYQPQLYLNDRHGQFALAPAGVLPALPISAGPVVAADYDRDGRLDVFLGGRVTPGEYPIAPRSALLHHDGAALRDVTADIAPGLATIGMISAALWTDVDGDGWLDLLLALQWGGVRCFHNASGRRFEDWSERAGFAAAGTGWWTSLAAADFNGDGQPDYVVGNVGLNTPYRASPERPAILLSGAVDETGRTQLIEAEDDGGRLVPVRGRSTMTMVLPWVASRIPTFRRYAAASVADIFGPERVAAARRFEATEFRSGVFLSQPDHTYRFTPLPRIAQIAPIYGMVAGDFDGDGHTDLYVVQNSYAPIPEVGRFDGGLSQLLRGDGRGQFTAVPPVASNLIVPGDAKALALLDLDRDGWPEFLVTRNNDRALVFGNTGVAGRHPLRIALRGRPGNLSAIGARITVELTDGGTQTCELHAGSGYYSQSTAAAFFGAPENNAPRRLRVRWPWGETTTAAVPPGALSLTVPAPAVAR